LKLLIEINTKETNSNYCILFVSHIYSFWNNKFTSFCLNVNINLIPENDNRNCYQICQGGKIPKELYTSNAEKLNEDYTTVVVQKGGKLEFDISAPEVGSILR